MGGNNRRTIVLVRRGGGILLALAAAFLAYLVASTPHREFDYENDVLPLARKYASATTTTTTPGAAAETNETSNKPLVGKTVVVTGATSGIGLSLSRTMSKLGATVVAIGRSPEKLAALKEELMQRQNGDAVIITVRAEMSDLSSVAAAADEILNDDRIDRLDVLINNAGVHDGYGLVKLLGGGLPWNAYNFSTPQGYDRVFATNYLSHFLLTEKLSSLLVSSATEENATTTANGDSRRPPRTTIVQISSLYHWAVDGSDLVLPPSSSSDSIPVAAQPGGSRGLFLFRTQRSYSNSKLAQILHARALKRRHRVLSKARLVSICPSWVATSIAGAPGSMGHKIINAAGYPPEGWGVASALHAVFDTISDDNDDFYSNTKFFDPFMQLLTRLPSWSYEWGVRDFLTNSIAYLGMAGQLFTPEAGPTKSSPESYNASIADQLYDWSLAAVEPYL